MLVKYRISRVGALLKGGNLKWCWAWGQWSLVFILWCCLICKSVFSCLEWTLQCCDMGGWVPWCTLWHWYMLLLDDLLLLLTYDSFYATTTDVRKIIYHVWEFCAPFDFLLRFALFICRFDFFRLSFVWFLILLNLFLFLLFALFYCCWFYMYLLFMLSAFCLSSFLLFMNFYLLWFDLLCCMLVWMDDWLDFMCSYFAIIATARLW